MTISQIEAKRLLAESIRNGRRNYNQARWSTKNQDRPATCGTACCIAGHIEAVFRKETKALFSKGNFEDMWGNLDHVGLANAVWKRVTGKPCRFDFNLPDLFDGERRYRQPTREDAVAHIYGRHPEWPLSDPK